MFADRKLEKRCGSDAAGRKAWGPDNWKLLQRRLASLIAAPDLEAMAGLPGRCHQLRGDMSENFAIAVWGSYRLVFVPDHDPIPRLHDGGVDRRNVTRISVKEVVDCHGN